MVWKKKWKYLVTETVRNVMVLVRLKAAVQRPVTLVEGRVW